MDENDFQEEFERIPHSCLDFINENLEIIKDHYERMHRKQINIRKMNDAIMALDSYFICLQNIGIIADGHGMCNWLINETHKNTK